jgi:hypothetical protein
VTTRPLEPITSECANAVRVTCVTPLKPHPSALRYPWSTYLNTLQFDYDAFTAEFDQVTAHIREQTAAAAPA